METKKYYNTDSGSALKSGKDSESNTNNRIKSIDEDEESGHSDFGTGKGSGTSSVDK